MKQESKNKLTLETLQMITCCLQYQEDKRADFTELYNHPYIKKPFEEQTFLKDLEEDQLNKLFPNRKRWKKKKKH